MLMILIHKTCFVETQHDIWRPPSQSELTPMKFNTGLKAQRPPFINQI